MKMNELNEQLNTTQKELQDTNAFCDRIGRIKMILFLLAGMLSLYNYGRPFGIIWGIVIALAVSIIILMVIHSKRNKHRRFLLAKSQVIQNLEFNSRPMVIREERKPGIRMKTGIIILWKVQRALLAATACFAMYLDFFH